jgi:hypothetical protein
VRVDLASLRILLATGLLSACGESAADDAAALPRWSVDARPVVEIGTGEGEDALYRVTSATRLRGGRIAVANAGTHQVKLFGERGEHLGSLGRRGAGPGEFQFPMWVGSHADSILVWDAALERLTVFDASGGFARTAQFPSLGGSFPRALDLFADGSLLLASGTDGEAAAREAGSWRGAMRLMRVDRRGAVLDTFPTVPSQERYSYRAGDGMGLVVEDLPFGRRTLVAVSGDGVVLGTGEEYVIRRLDAGGESHEVVRVPWTPHAVSRGDVREYWSRMVTIGSRAEPAESEARRDRIPYPSTLPPYEQLLVDAEGSLWIKDAQPPAGWDDPDVWRIYSADGAPRATIELPARVRPQAIGEDWILAIALDGAQREMVRVYRYRRS